MENTTNEAESGVEPNVSNENKKPVWSGIKLFLFDVGLSVAFGFIVGIFIGITGSFDTTIDTHPLVIIIGLLISVYSAYFLYRKHSQDIRSLVSMALIGAFVSIMSSYATSLASDFDLVRDAAMVLVIVLAYVIGWYVAKNTKLNIYMPKRKLTTAFVVLGCIVVFFMLIGLVVILSA